MVMDLERAGEAEITIFEKDTPYSTPLCVAWFRLSELDEEIKGIAQGYLRASGIGTGAVSMDNDGGVGADQEAVARAAQAVEKLEREGVECWLEMEPAGRLLVKLNVGGLRGTGGWDSFADSTQP
jgi:hypothetical protein